MAINFNPQVMINIKTLGSGIKKPDENRNYCLYDKNKVEFLAANANEALPSIIEYLKTSNDENGILEALFAVDKIADDMNTAEIGGARRLYNIYPYLARFNDTNSPEIQVMLAGIYRKTLVPDAFGPLCNMLHKQITNPVSKYFDPKEETGGAILEYIRAYGASNIYASAAPASYASIIGVA